MKLAIKFVVYTVLASVCEIAMAQITAPSLWQKGNPPDGFEISTNQFLTGSNSAPIILAERPAASSALKPGIYQTKPFTCKVLVPGPTHDDCSMLGATNTNSTTIISKPDLQFIPLPQNGK